MFAIRIIQPEGHPVASGVYVAELLRHAAAHVETQAVIDESRIEYGADGLVKYEWTTKVEEPPPPPEE